jgi:hypothetical protein
MSPWVSTAKHLAAEPTGDDLVIALTLVDRDDDNLIGRHSKQPNRSASMGSDGVEGTRRNCVASEGANRNWPN